jgi:hypothetical protein
MESAAGAVVWSVKGGGDEGTSFTSYKFLESWML